MNLMLWIVVALAAIVVGKEVGKLAFGAKKNLTGMRRAAQSLSIALREAGLTRIPAALENFCVGDLDDLLEGIKELSVTLKSGDGVIMKELEQTFDRMLGCKLKSPEGRALVEAKLAEAKKVALEVAKVALPVVVAAL
jgi:putative component of toxin-antitoxin plasmid stabilization module